MFPKIFFSEFFLLFFLHSFSQCIHCSWKRLLQQKSKEKAFKLLKLMPLGREKHLRPRGNSGHKNQMGKHCYLQSDQLCLILSYPLLSVISTRGLVSSLNFFSLEKEEGETLNMFENLRKDVIVDILLLLDMRKPLSPRKEAGCKIFLMSRSSRMSGSV